MNNARFILFLALSSAARSLDLKDIVITVLSQENQHHVALAQNLQEDIFQQAENLNREKPIVHFSHADFPHVGDWTILPLVSSLCSVHKLNTSWIVFVEDRTKICLGKLLATLSKHDSSKPIWLGHALHDREATIIHHFAFYENPREFKYPNLASGIAISTTLLKRLDERLKENSAPNSEFGIDNAHELALFIWSKGLGEVLTHEPSFCIREQPDCSTFPTSFKQCGALVPKDSIYFAVKTCKKFHFDRVPVVKHTWAQHATKIEFFSDVSDESIPTVALGVPNTEQGHCGKTMAIMRHVNEQLSTDADIRWIVIADDDTILGVSKIQQLLSCYNSSSWTALGERYGYKVHTSRGYNYITGGGGMVFSRVLVQELVRPGVCECPMINTPDDMYLGVCIAGLGVGVTHSPHFHQARPGDYPPEYLHSKEAVSFHKHWMVDPINVYNNWFAADDLRVSNNVHNEL